MITKKVIDEIYRQYGKKPKDTDSLDIAMLFEKAGIEHDILIDPETNQLTIASIPEDSPFHSISLKNIHAFVPFEEWVGIVLHSSIIFLNCQKPISSIHLKQDKPSFWKRMTSALS